MIYLDSKVEISIEGVDQRVFDSYQLEDWLIAVENEFKVSKNSSWSVSLKFLGKKEMQSINEKFRSKNSPTNVLAFPSGTDLIREAGFLGDIAICPEIVFEEAKHQKKDLSHHMAHLFIHGVLHLLGHDHEQSDNALIMEDLERKILSKIGVADPY